MKSTLKVTNVLGLPFITGSVSIDDFQKRPDSEKRSEAKPSRRFLNSTFHNDYATWGCFYELPEELVKQLSEVHEYRHAFGDYGELQRLGRRVHHEIDAEIGRVRKEENAQKKCDEANAELERWIQEESGQFILDTLTSMIQHIHEVRDRVNEDSARRLATHCVQHIDDDADELSVLSQLMKLVEKCRKELDDAEARELAERKRLSLEWLADKSNVPKELKQDVQKWINERQHLHDTIGRY